MSSPQTETVAPVRVMAAQRPLLFSDRPIILHHILRAWVALDYERGAHFVGRPTHLTTCHRPPPEAPVPATASSPRTHQRNARNTIEVLSRFVARQIELGHEATLVGAEVAGWPMALVRVPPATHTEVHLQVPFDHLQVMARLWEAGLRIDGFAYQHGRLSTCVDDPQTIDQVRAVVAWLTALLTGTPLPPVPEPYSLNAGRCLRERIDAYDEHSPIFS